MSAGARQQTAAGAISAATALPAARMVAGGIGAPSPAGAAGATVAEQPPGRAGSPAISAVTAAAHAVSAGATLSARSTGADQPGGPARTAVAAVAAEGEGVGVGAVPSGAAGSTGAEQQPGRSAVASGLAGAGRAGRAVAAVTDQDPGISAVSARRRRVGAVADQRAPHQRLGGRVDRSQYALFQVLQRRGVRRLSTGIRAGTRLEGLHKPVVKRRHLGAYRLILLRVRAE
ncbi:hypothetical protein MSIMFI_04390 [Mycobacterium simulans]|nr:hypothetical protein MSIMFI_04390 [Mycobacterium simulans]